MKKSVVDEIFDELQVLEGSGRRRRHSVVGMAGIAAVLGAPALAGLMQFATVQPAAATTQTTYVVNSTADTSSGTNGAGDCAAPFPGSTCTLLDAINQYNNDTAGSDVITFSAHGTFGLGAKLEINNINAVPLTILGSGPSSTIIDGSETDDEGTLDTDSCFECSAGTGAITISGVTIRNGNATSGPLDGGAINNGGTLTLTNSIVSSNTSTEGGAINSSGTLTLSGDTFSGNTATASDGGAIFSDGPLTATGDTFVGNTSDSDAGGAIFSEGTLSASNDTFFNNSAASGGGVYYDDDTTDGFLTNDTFSNDVGDEVYNTSDTGVDIANSVLSEALGDVDLCAGNITDDGYNVESDNSCFGLHTTTGSLVNNTTINLATSLAANGSTGPNTLAIGSDSSAFEEVPSDNCTIPTDERGDPRPGVSAQNCDAGAYEAQTPLTQVIAFGALGAKTLAQSPVTVSADASSELPVTFTTTTTGVCTAGVVNSAIITLHTTGMCTVVAHQAGDGSSWQAARTVSQSFSVSLATQTISFGSLSAKTLLQSPVSVSASSTSSLPVTFTTTTTGVCTAGGTNGTSITLLTYGICTVVAHQAGNSSWQAAPSVSQSFSVTESTQKITFLPPLNQTLAVPSVLVSATSTSGLTVTFTTTTPGVCSPSGTNGATIVLNGTGICTVAANQAGDSSHQPAPTVSESFSVSKATQKITFAPPVTQPLGESQFTVSASSSSTLTVTFSTTTSAVCSVGVVNSAVITLNEVGTCTLVAHQVGNSDFQAAPTVTQSFRVNNPGP